jgi:hypothetical protein
LLLRGIHASRREGNRHGATGILRRLLDACAAAQNDQVREREVVPYGRQVEALELFGVLAHGIGQGRALVQDLEFS